MGTQPRDLLMAWLSFLAGDFCEEDEGGRDKKKRPSHSKKSFKLRGNLHNWVKPLLSVSDVWISGRSSAAKLQHDESIILPVIQESQARCADNKTVHIPIQTWFNYFFSNLYLEARML